MVLSKRIGTALVILAFACAGCSNGRLAILSNSPPPAQNFIVFFPGDTTELTGEGQGVVVQIASTAKAANPKRITVMGQDDGGTAHDAAIAAERGKTVANALVAAGLKPALVVLVPGVPSANATGIAAHKVVVNFES